MSGRPYARFTGSIHVVVTLSVALDTHAWSLGVRHSPRERHDGTLCKLRRDDASAGCGASPATIPISPQSYLEFSATQPNVTTLADAQAAWVRSRQVSAIGCRGQPTGNGPDRPAARRESPTENPTRPGLGGGYASLVVDCNPELGQRISDLSTHTVQVIHEKGPHIHTSRASHILLAKPGDA